MSDVPAAAEPPAPQRLLEVTCPGCGAQLRNVSAEPGASIRCLNCGARHVAVPLNGPLAGPSVSPELPIGATAGAQPAPLKREPGAAGYWILRIPAMVFFLLAAFVSIFLSILLVQDLLRSSYYFWDRLLAGMFIPLLPFYGFLALMVTRSLARVEANTLKATWKNGLLIQALPAPPGSSLPYFGPLTIGMGVMLIVFPVLARDEQNSRRVLEVAVPLGIASMFSFLVAFMFTDARQFFWRQQALAAECARSSGKDPEEIFVPPILGGLCGMISVSGAPFFAGIFIEDISNSYRYNDHADSWMLPLLALTLLATSLTLYLLGRSFSQAVMVWRKADPSGAGPGLPAFLMRCVLFSFAGAGLLYMLAFSNAHAEYMRLGEFVGVFGASCFGVSVSLALSQIYAEVRAWRLAQERFWRARKLLASAPMLHPLLSVVIWGSVAMAFAQAMAFAGILYEGMWSRLDWESALGFPLLTFIVNFPTVWSALTAREFLLADRMTSSLIENASA